MKPFSYWVFDNILPELEFKVVLDSVYQKNNFSFHQRTAQFADWLNSPEVLRIFMGPTFKGKIEEATGLKLKVNREIFPSLRRRIGPNAGMVVHNDYEDDDSKFACTYYLNEMPKGQGTLKIWKKISDTKLELHEAIEIKPNRLVVIRATADSYHSVESIADGITRDTIVMGLKIDS